MSNIRLAKVRRSISDLLRKVRMFLSRLLHMVDYWTSSELDMAEVHISICELLPECESVQLPAFSGKGAYLATFPLFLFVFKFMENS